MKGCKNDMIEHDLTCPDLIANDSKLFGFQNDWKN